MGHYPTPPHDNIVTLVPELRRSRDGWSGKGWTADGETWRVVNNIIKIRYSDADYNRVPSEEQRKRTVDNEGNFSEYVRASEDNHLYQLWMRKIGRLLADWVLQKGLYGASNGNPFYLPRTRTNDRGKKNKLDSFAPMEAHKVSRRLHALDTQVGRRNGPRQPAHRRIPLRRTSPRSDHRSHLIGPSRADDLPLPHGVRRARDMAHAPRRGAMPVQVLHPRPKSDRHQPPALSRQLGQRQRRRRHRHRHRWRWQ
jgi:hypothetical protein